MKLKSFHYYIFFIVLAIGGMVAARYWGESQPGQYDEFAQCVNDSGAKFYGAFWCPHCDDQKQLFGNSAKLLPYIECSTPDRQNQTQICIDEEILGYPTWEDSEGNRYDGNQSLEQIAEFTGCELPQ